MVCEPRQKTKMRCVVLPFTVSLHVMFSCLVNEFSKLQLSKLLQLDMGRDGSRSRSPPAPALVVVLALALTSALAPAPALVAAVSSRHYASTLSVSSRPNPSSLPSLCFPWLLSLGWWGSLVCWLHSSNGTIEVDYSLAT